MTAQPSNASHPSKKKRGWGLATTVLLDVVTVLALVLFVFLRAEHSIGGALVVTPPGAAESQDLAVQDAMKAALFSCLLATVLAVALNRLATRPRRTYQLIGWGAVVLWGVMGLVAAADLQTALWLNILNLAVAIPILGGLARWLPADNQSELGATYLPLDPDPAE